VEPPKPEPEKKQSKPKAKKKTQIVSVPDCDLGEISPPKNTLPPINFGIGIDFNSLIDEELEALL
jgi:hypothetical protein